MARKKQKSYAGIVIVLMILTAGIAMAVVNKTGDPIPFEEPPTEFDDDWGKLDTPVAKATITHTLISWAGKSPGRVTPKDPKRTEKQARELVEKLWLDYLNDPTDENWKSIQAEHNEDTQPHNVYEVPDTGLVQPFNDCGLSTKVNHARITESDFGYHLIRREK